MAKHLVTMCEALLVRLFSNSELIPYLTERQKCYIKWQAVWTNRNVSDTLILPSLSEDAKAAFQVISCCKIFEIGYPLRILGKITTSPAIRTMKGQQRGSFRVIPSRNGNHPGQVLSSGYMANVSRCLHHTFADADSFPLSQPEQGKVSFGTITSQYFVSRTYGTG